MHPFEHKTAQDILELEKSGKLHGAYKIDEHEYHSLKFISSSVLKDVYGHSLLKAKEYFNGKQRTISNHMGGNGTTLTAFGFGSAFHMHILEPELFNQTYAFIPYHFNKKEQDAFKFDNDDKILINASDGYAMKQMAERLIRHNGRFNELTQHGCAELAVFWNDQITGLPCKAKFDWWNPNFGIVDLKTTRNIANREGMRLDIANRYYDIQAYHYSVGYRAIFPDLPCGFEFVFSEKSFPFDSNTCQFTKDNGLALLDTYNWLVGAINKSLSENYWPGHTERSLEFINPIRGENYGIVNPSPDL